MKHLKLGILPLIALMSIACQPKDKVETTDAATADSTVVDSTSVALPTGDTSENSLDWAGTYEATLPCADCDGLKTVLTLNADKTFTLNQEYLGKGTKSEDKGSFEWNTEGNQIILNGKGEQYRYKVGENQLIQLDQQGQEITGATKDLYVFKKK